MEPANRHHQPGHGSPCYRLGRTLHSPFWSIGHRDHYSIIAIVITGANIIAYFAFITCILILKNLLFSQFFIWLTLCGKANSNVFYTCQCVVIHHMINLYGSSGPSQVWALCMQYQRVHYIFANISTYDKAWYQGHLGFNVADWSFTVTLACLCYQKR